jgi:ferrous iron transport protein B
MPTLDVVQSTLVVALAGNPNSGKTTLFNALTGLRQKVANYPGVTVEKKSGRCPLGGGVCAEIIDLPGTYSLISRSPDEVIAMEVLRGLRSDTPAPQVVVAVVDASNLQRNLYLVSQLIELGRPLVVALTMVDIAEMRGQRVDADGLSKKLGVPVIPVAAHKRKSLDALKRAMLEARPAPMPDWPLPEAMREELVTVGGGLAILAPDRPDTHNTPLDRYHAIAERLLIGDRAADIEPLSRQEPVASLLNHATSRLEQLGIDPMQADIEAHYKWIEHVCATCDTGFQPVHGNEQTQSVIAGEYESTSHGLKARVTGTLEYQPSQITLTDRLDHVFLHKFWGLLVFAAVMVSLFMAIFFLADPLMGATEEGVAWVGEQVGRLLPAEGPVHDLWTDGIVAGVGAVVVFVPQIAMLFLLLSILEDTGYLSRAAFLMDKLLAKVGLNGKAFIPLLSGFACAIPGIMATRVMENRRERMATIFVLPFMSCSARLPVYALLIGTFFASYGAAVQGGILFSMYVIGILAAVGTALVFKRSNRGLPRTPFIMELPVYRLPRVGNVLRQMWMSTREFLVKAGTTIFCLSVILWAMTYYPRLPAERVKAVQSEARDDAVMEAFLGSYLNATLEAWRTGRAPTTAEARADISRRIDAIVGQKVAAEQLRYSIAGRFGRVLEPVIRPLGYDWKMGIGLIGSFAAREVFVSTMAITYGAGSEDDTADLSAVMQADAYADGSKVWTPLVAISLLVWFVLAMQCMSTLAVVRRETGSWKWALGMLIYMNALAYVVCLAIYQVGRLVV